MDIVWPPHEWVLGRIQVVNGRIWTVVFEFPRIQHALFVVSFWIQPVGAKQ